jgi:hypothetical protein
MAERVGVEVAVGREARVFGVPSFEERLSASVDHGPPVGLDVLDGEVGQAGEDEGLAKLRKSS